MSVTVRFAPSPTGYLHIGNLRPALFNWLFAKTAGGRFILRIDDTDVARSREEFARAIEEDLRWIGIVPDERVRQSDRLALYDAAADRLREKGLLYACYETPDELERRRRRAMAAGRPPVYGRDALRLTEDERRRLEAEGRRPHWRFLLPNFREDPHRPERTELGWDDLVRSEQAVDLASFSDPVLVREDGSYLYTLPSVVDDGALAVTHVIRGDDHLTNTAVQIALMRALDLQVPVFGHHNLLTTIDGEGLSKRSGALSLRTLREAGYEPMALASLAAMTGAAGAVEPAADLTDLAERATLATTSASNAKFDPAELDRLNAAIVHAMPYEEAAPRLAAMRVPEEMAEAFWLAVRGNCERVTEAESWRRAVYQGPAGELEWGAEERDFLSAARDLLPDEPFSEGTWADWTGRVKSETGRKGRALFLPLRRALTGVDHGPELAALLPLIGRAEALRRLG